MRSGCAAYFIGTIIFGNVKDFILQVSVYAVPGAKRTELAGTYDGALRVRLNAPPVDGQANAALISWAADYFKLPKKCVELRHGASGRRKLLSLYFAGESDYLQAQKKIPHAAVS